MSMINLTSITYHSSTCLHPASTAELALDDLRSQPQNSRKMEKFNKGTIQKLAAIVQLFRMS
jgi:hypothetical protein